MKIPAVLLSIALAGSAVAQLDGLPSCAQSCANQYLTGGIPGCGTADVQCICGNSGFISGIACCLAGVCDAADQTSAVAFASGICGAAGVSVPSAVTCTSTTSSSGPADTSATTTATGTDSTTSAPPASTTTGTATGASNPTSTSQSSNFGPRPTAAAGLGAIGGIMAAVALL
ncbi:hypothetical protein N656DRAFT_798419 [Canariomyces notabilis]|uniref:CFEM domain-containing protein n=1 Tax=Canariomyces notabilis TaxID=2074819 RepID=A0AAN6YSL6_9PEZI|nr:hypothetical protein N656DRAFT_798419 [Canariomyces arenarius]